MNGKLEETNGYLTYGEILEGKIYKVVECTNNNALNAILRGCGNNNYGIYAIVLLSPNNPDGNWRFLTHRSLGFDSMRFQEIKSGKLTLEW